jgi:hypothetical protein
VRPPLAWEEQHATQFVAVLREVLLSLR